VIAESLNEQELEESWNAQEPSLRHASSWPAWAGTGSDAAACYFEIPAGCSLGRHVHDCEEQVVLLEGAATATVGGARSRVEAPAVVVMPQGETHDLENDGPATLRAVGYFPEPSVTTTFEVELQPRGSKIMGTPDRTG
jgi:quercetin dioxygenase-like cupin family protein